MEINPSQSISRFVLELKESAAVLEKYGIPYYLEGDKTLSEACARAGASLERVESELNQCEPIPPGELSKEREWQKESMASLIRYIVHVHHVKTHSLLDNFENALVELVSKNPDSPNLGIIRDLFLSFAKSFRIHMLDEEKLIFPYLIYAERELERGATVETLVRKDRGFSDTIRNILFEHRFMDKEFHEIEELVALLESDHSLASLDKELKKLKEDHQKHSHLENQFLLKRTAQLGLMD